MNIQSVGLPQIRLAELLGALSHALDMVEGQPAGHCVRCCWIGIHVGREIGLNEQQIRELYYTLLLKDLGCSDGSLAQALRFILSHTGMKAGLAERFRTLVRVFIQSGEIARELVETRCQRGADIARMMRFSEAVALGIQNLDEHWDGGGQPLNLRGDAIPICSRIAVLSQVVDVFQVANGVETAKSAVSERSGTWFDPHLAAAFERIASRPHFWDMLRSPKLQQAIFGLEPAQHSSLVEED